MRVHIAGNRVTVDARYLRQRCAWCGEVLLEEHPNATVKVSR